MKQIQYHTTHPHYKTTVRPNDNAVGNHWRKSVWGNPVAVSPNWALVGKGALQEAGGILSPRPMGTKQLGVH